MFPIKFRLRSLSYRYVSLGNISLSWHQTLLKQKEMFWQNLSVFFRDSISRSAAYYLQVPEVKEFCSVVTILDNGENLDKCPVTVDAMEKIIGLNTDMPGYSVADIRQGIIDGDVESEAVLRELFEQLIADYYNNSRQQLLCSADQAIFGKFQMYASKKEWDHLKPICLNQEMWHKGLNICEIWYET